MLAGGAPPPAGHIDDFPPGTATRLDLRSEAGSAEVYVTRLPGGEVLVLARKAVVVGLGDLRRQDRGFAR